MATYDITANATLGTGGQILSSTKVKVTSNVAVYVAVGNASARATTSNCQIIPANITTTVNCGPGNLVVANTVPVGTNVGPFISFLAVSGTTPAAISVTEIGYVNFNIVSA
jgi:hypothetical protein